MSSSVLDEEKVTISKDGDHDRFQHYFKKKDISDNLLEGKPMTALCGKTVTQQVDPAGRTVCTTCKAVVESLP